MQLLCCDGLLRIRSNLGIGSRSHSDFLRPSAGWVLSADTAIADKGTLKRRKCTSSDASYLDSVGCFGQSFRKGIGADRAARTTPTSPSGEEKRWPGEQLTPPRGFLENSSSAWFASARDASCYRRLRYSASATQARIPEDATRDLAALEEREETRLRRSAPRSTPMTLKIPRRAR